MKKFTFFAALSLLLTVTANAQGVSKLFGLVGGNVQTNQSSNGFLFSTDSSGNNFQLQYNFPVTTFGANPQNVEMASYNGKLYGTTSTGGVNNFGTIFEYDPVSNEYTKKFDFGPTVSVTGGSPKGSLLLYNNKFYGLAADYGVSGGGVIFEWDPGANVYTKKYDLVGSGGSNPQNSLRLMNGKMYGTTASGGASNVGVVFEWDPATNVYTKLVDLNGAGAGSYGWTFYNNVTPYNNKLYCMTQQGGVNNYGTLLMVDPTLPYGANTTIIKQFDGVSGGAANNNEMIIYNNKLYGCLNAAGVNSQGTLFELDPVGNIFTKLVDFNYSTTGGGPLGKLVLNGTKFLGLCTTGGTNGTGTVFEWDPSLPSTIVKKYDFPVNNYNNPINPGNGSFVLFNSKFYATTYNASFTNQGTLFEYDYTANMVTKKLTFNAAENGRIPHGKPVLLNGKIYGTCYQGPQEIFGTPYGCLWEFDPSTSIYSRKFLFDNTNSAANGRAPFSSPIAYNGKLYGTTNNGGNADRGVLYSFDPVTNVYLKYSLRDINGDFPIGEPTLYNNKLYGMTNANGTGNTGIIYSFDPATSTLVKLLDIQGSGSLTPSGGFTVYNNKLYGTTSGGGVNNAGGIIVYDPVLNTATTPASFVGSAGVNAANAPTLFNNKFYLTTLSGGANGRGAILQFDPATNTLTNQYSFSTATGGTGYDPKGALTVSGDKLYCITQESNNIVKVVQFDPVANTVSTQSTFNVNNLNVPVTHNGLTVVPAFIANGIPGSCENYTTININASNNNQWVPILNATGDVVAEIKANGNNLGNVSASVYINNGTVREDGAKHLYLDRNISIATQNPVSGANVDIRLYIKTTEYLALINANNSIGVTSGINSINDVAIFKNDQTCNNMVTFNASNIATTTSVYEYGYVLSASINSFSSFYFAKSSLITLPLNLVSFKAAKDGNKVLLKWNTENEINMLRFDVEKSVDGINFYRIDEKAAIEGYRNSYQSTDPNVVNGINFYRLKMFNKDGSYRYSHTVTVDYTAYEPFTIFPNPAHDIIKIQSGKNYSEIQIFTITGVQVSRYKRTVSDKYNITGLQQGVYLVKLTGLNGSIVQKLVVE
ncbi:MAG: T9SS type A sorting domain-containing protein [Ferruginibacter sp.]|nr:T9SS type A sorting domain-containing protein [Ferruginibacter sp.]